MTERVSKILSAYGVASRRAAEQMMRDGRVKVNGLSVEPGAKADPAQDNIQVDGLPLAHMPALVYLMLNKPKGVVCTLSDERGRTNVTALLSGLSERVVPVGRLDMDSEGLLLMTNDGDLVHKLTHPSFEVEKIYHVWVEGPVESATQIMSREMTIDGYTINPAQIGLLSQTESGGVLSVAIREGRKRQVRRMCAQAGLSVARLVRVSEGNLQLGGLEPGAWRFLTNAEIAQLKTVVQANPSGRKDGKPWLRQ